MVMISATLINTETDSF